MSIAPEELTLATTCMGRLEFLKQSFPTWRQVLGDRVEVVVVDYSCPDGSGGWAEARGARVVRCGGVKAFSKSHSTNLAIAAARTKWVLLTDADVRLTAAFAGVLAGASSGHYYRVHGFVAGLPGTFLVEREALAMVEGFDEVLEGWGSDDNDLAARLEIAGVRPGALDPAALSHIDHDDSLRTSNHAQRDMQLQNDINSAYSSVKLHLLRSVGAIPVEHRRQLYGMVKAGITRAKTAGEPYALNIPLPDGEVGNLKVEAQMSWRFRY
jgi:glycosyltransferase involved in cell wall biosynthesis